jgi:hypothetical protein
LQTCAALALALSALASAVAAQSPPPITSNRPGISESEALVLPHAVQVEAGVTYSALSDDAERHKQVDFPEATIRVGLTERVEVFVAATGYFVDMTADAGTTRGGSDVQINAKLGLLDRGSFTLSAATGLSLPIGSAAFSSGGYDPSLRFLWSTSLPRDWSVAGNLVFSDVTIEENRRAAAGASLSTGHPLVHASAWFAELFGNATNDERSLWRLDGGVAIPVRSDFQIDVSGGRTLATGPSSWFLGAGISARHRAHPH